MTISNSYQSLRVTIRGMECRLIPIQTVTLADGLRMVRAAGEGIEDTLTIRDLIAGLRAKYAASWSVDPELVRIAREETPIPQGTSIAEQLRQLQADAQARGIDFETTFDKRPLREKRGGDA